MIIRNTEDRFLIQQILYRQCEQYNNCHWDDGGPIRNAVSAWLDQASDEQLEKAYDPFFSEWTDAMKKQQIPVNSDKPWGFSFVDRS